MAFDIGPRILVEALNIYFSGGASVISKAGLTTKEFMKLFLKETVKEGVKVLKASKPIVKNALKDLARNPRPYIVTTVQFLLNDSINWLDKLQQKTKLFKNKKILNYEEIMALEEAFWEFVPTGHVAIKMYQEISGDLISNILRAFQNMVDQLISEVEYTKEIITSVFIAKQLPKFLGTLKVSKAAVIEMRRWKEIRKNEIEVLLTHRESQIELAIKIAKEFTKLPQFNVLTSTALSLIIDSSGSMSNNDPHNARIYGGELVLDQGKNNWKIGIVDFDSSSKLLGSGTLNDQNLKAALKQIDSDGGTNIQSGLKDGFDFLEKTTGWKKGAILLTDGDHNTPSRNFDYNQYVNIYTQKGWPVYTLGLTGDANAVLLSKIAAITGGVYFKANTYQDMLGIIDIILSHFKDETLICHYKNNIKQGEEKEFPFLLDDSVALIDMTGTYPGSKVDFSLIDPQNRELSRTNASRGVQVTEGKIYKIIKVKKPMPGQWKAKVKGLQVDRQAEPFDVKISADTPIKVETKEAKPVYIPFEPIKFKVNTAGNVNDKSLAYTVNVTPPEGKPENIPLRKSSQVVYPKTQKPGVYYFKVKVTGEKTDKEQFMREGLKHIVVSDSGKEYGVGQIINMMGGYFEIDLGKEIGLKIGKKIFVFSRSGGVKKKIAEGFVTSVSQGKSMVQLTASWAIEPPKVGNRVEIDRKEF